MARDKSILVFLATCTTMYLPLPVGATGLGNVTGDPVMGERLTLEIPLIEPENINIECFRLLPHPNGSDIQFFPRRAELKLKNDKGDKHATLIIDGSIVTQPVVEFRVAVTCGTQVARDFVLFAAPGRELRYQPVSLETPSVAAGAPPVAAQEPARRMTRPGPTLEQMAGSRYPHHSGKRAQFKKRMRQANPRELQGMADDAPIPLEVDLTFPDDIYPTVVPVTIPTANKKLSAQPADQKTSGPLPLPQPRQSSPVAKLPQASETKAGDRLTIGSGVGMESATQPIGAVDGALQEKMGASFSAQEEMAAKLAQSEASFNELKEQILHMERRMAAIEQQRQHLEEENRKKSEWSILQGVLSIFGGGLLGALLMIFLQRRRERRNDYTESVFDIGEISNRK